jgi:hypothetical protein
MRGCWEEFALEPEHDKQAVLEMFYAKHAPCTDTEKCLKVKFVVDRLAGRPTAIPPQAFLDDAILVLQDAGLQVTPAALVSLTGASLQVARNHVLEWGAAHPEQALPVATHFSSSVGDHEAQVIGRLPAHLRKAPGTYLAAGAHPDDKPDEAMFARLNSIRNQVLFEALTLDVLRLAASRTNAVLQNHAARAFQRFDTALGSRDARDPFVIREVLERHLGPQWLSTKQAEGNSCETVARYLHVFERLQNYIECTVPKTLQGSFLPHQLTLPAGSDKFFRQVKNAVSKYQKACSASRQSRIEKILDNPLEFLLVGRLRLIEHVGIRDVCRAEIDKIIRSGEVLTEPYRFSHSYETRLVNDRFRVCKQTLYLAIWPWRLLHNELRRSGQREGFKTPVYANNMEENEAHRSGYVVAYLGVSPQEPGGPTQTPLIAEVADSFILARGLTIEQYTRQADAFERWEFSPKLSKTAGLPWFEKLRCHAARDANALLTNIRADGTETPMVLLPHEEFAHGLMFAHNAVFISADAGCRTGETLLAPSQAAEFEPIVDPESGDVFKRFDSIGKFGLKVQPMISPDTFKYLTDMIIETAKRWHGGKLAPPVAPNYHFQEREIKTVKRYAFSLAEEMIGYSQVATLARVLYLGWHGLKGHDVRHLFNAMGRRAGIPHAVRQRLLNHTAPGSTDLYGPATPDEVSRQQIKLKKHTSERMAALLETSADGMSQDMRVALRELQRAELTQRFYREGGWKDEADNLEREVREWADKLARATAAHTRGDEVIRAENI